MKDDKKRKKAVALSYNTEKDHAPKVTATGKGLVADTILARGNEHNVPIYEDASLVELLSKLSINDSIPEQLYSAVAEVFAFIYEADQMYHKKTANKG